MNDFMNFFKDYMGAIIGALVAVLILLAKLDKLFVVIILIAVGAFLGNYVQKNKNDVKARLQKFIDKM